MIQKLLKNLEYSDDKEFKFSWAQWFRSYYLHYHNTPKYYISVIICQKCHSHLNQAFGLPFWLIFLLYLTINQSGFPMSHFTPWINLGSLVVKKVAFLLTKIFQSEYSKLTNPIWCTTLISNELKWNEVGRIKRFEHHLWIWKNCLIETWRQKEKWYIAQETHSNIKSHQKSYKIAILFIQTREVIIKLWG